jgi:protoporphyrinogen oxidase
MDSANDRFRKVIILGGGPAGLAAGYELTQADIDALIIEQSSSVGGLAKTMRHDGFRFDIGGHRFITDNKKLERTVKKILPEEILVVARSSKILLKNKYFDYPIKLWNALSGMGLLTSIRIIVEYIFEQVKHRLKKYPVVSLEDWVVRQFGRTMFNIFFKGYSEKVWGIPCDKIAMEWVNRRIQGLSLGLTLKKAFLNSKPGQTRTLADKFLYPAFGIGQIADGLKAEIEQKNEIITSSSIVRINRSDSWVDSVTVETDGTTQEYYANEFISSIPLTAVIKLLDPPPTEAVIKAANCLKFRDLVVVTIMINRERVTNQTWIYIPDSAIPFGRIHEPKNWSSKMAPEGKTHLVVEYFCFSGGAIWSKTDRELEQLTVEHLNQLGFIELDELIDSVVLRIPKAYPLFEVDFQKHQKTIFDYLDRFENLHLIGRGGKFEYYNSDHAMESGMTVAEEIISRDRIGDLDQRATQDPTGIIRS